MTNGAFCDYSWCFVELGECKRAYLKRDIISSDKVCLMTTCANVRECISKVAFSREISRVTVRLPDRVEEKQSLVLIYMWSFTLQGQFRHTERERENERGREGGREGREVWPNTLCSQELAVAECGHQKTKEAEKWTGKPSHTHVLWHSVCFGCVVRDEEALLETLPLSDNTQF